MNRDLTEFGASVENDYKQKCGASIVASSRLVRWADRTSRRITRGRIDRAVAEIGLQRSGIDPLIRQRVAAGLPEHWLYRPQAVSAASQAAGSFLIR